ncbi:MAG: phytoene desaturase [Calditrichaeota bacterium]|nr:phytoene desaturase [Calditrichota bacterium]
MKKAIIIGSGFGGLATGIRLQSAGIDVTIFEKNSAVGGHASQLKKNGFTFDMGPSLITAPSIINSVFESAGKRMEDYINMRYLDPFYRVYFHDKSYIDYSGHADKMKQQMSAFNKNDSLNYDKFTDYTRQLHKAVIFDGLGSESFNFSKLVQFLPMAFKLNAFRNCYRMVSQFFSDPRHRFLFSFHSLFIGGNPFRAPSVYLMIPYLEKSAGVWYARGGMYSLVQAFEKLFIDLGGKIQCNSEIKSIEINGNKTIGVRTVDQFHPADIVISNAHFGHTQLDLIDPAKRRKWTDKRVKSLDYSMSCFLIYMGVKKQYPQLQHHTLVLSKRYKELIRDIFDRKVLADDFSIYLHVPSKTDDTMAPPGCESIYALIPVPNLNAAIDWSSQAERFKNKIIDFLERDFGLEGLRANLKVCETFTPEDFRTERNNYLGSAWGPEPKLTQSAAFRPSNKSEDIENFYISGAGTHPGAGLPGVLLGAEATVKEIIADLKTPLNSTWDIKKQVSHV